MPIWRHDGFVQFFVLADRSHPATTGIISLDEYEFSIPGYFALAAVPELIVFGVVSVQPGCAAMEAIGDMASPTALLVASR